MFFFYLRESANSIGSAESHHFFDDRDDDVVAYDNCFVERKSGQQAVASVRTWGKLLGQSFWLWNVTEN